MEKTKTIFTSREAKCDNKGMSTFLLVEVDTKTWRNLNILSGFTGPS